MRKTIALIVIVLFLAGMALAANKESGSTTLTNVQPAGTTDKQHKKQQYDLIFSQLHERIHLPDQRKRKGERDGLGRRQHDQLQDQRQQGRGEEHRERQEREVHGGARRRRNSARAVNRPNGSFERPQLHRLRKETGKRIPRGLKPARNGKNKGVVRHG